MLLEYVIAQPGKGILEWPRKLNPDRKDTYFRQCREHFSVIYGALGKSPSDSLSTQYPNSPNQKLFSFKAEMTIKINMVWGG